MLDAARRVSLSACQSLRSLRALLSFDKNAQALPTSGRGFNKLAVQKALGHAEVQWKRMSVKDYPNGALVFCSEDFAELVQSPVPLTYRIYSCHNHFDTTFLENAMKQFSAPAYGILVVDGSGATFGTAQGLTAVPSVIGHTKAVISSNSRKGGQSAKRFDHLHEESALAFLRQVAEKIAKPFEHVNKLIVAGKADMKRCLVRELPQAMRAKVVCVLDISCDANADGLRQAILCARNMDAVKADEFSEVEQAVKEFLDLTNISLEMCCFGASMTAAAMEMGAVNKLLVSKAYDRNNDIDGRAVQDWKAMAKLYGTQVIEVEPRSTQATQFCTNYGIGACLRWPVDFDALDEVASTHEPSEPAEPSEDLEVLDGPASAPPESSQSVPKEITIAGSCGWEEGAHAEQDRLYRCAECGDAAKLGAIDEADGLWYCKACWEALLNQPTEMLDCQTSDSTIAEVSGNTASVARTVPCLLEWLHGRLIADIDDQCTVDGLMSWAEVLLTDESATEDCEEWESPMTQLRVLFHDEGVPEEIVSQLAHRWASISGSQ
jgi:peptide subunit release factor 1 (eRF1)